ncbi:GNAT family N-acetyltransferase [Vogesella amnigena]|uniref:GNAT family N-acetyltransferase n=1 Tax=Vogesella amnigena TaxID=1507449 RepID=A0ABV7TUA9_9NEIS
MPQSPSEAVFEWAQPQTLPGDAPIYMSERYQSLFAAQDASEARLLLCRTGNQVAWLPLLVRKVGDGIHEAYSAYGYGGLFGGLTLTDECVHGLRAFLYDAGIVALFLRHSPFLVNQLLVPSHLTRLNRITYAATLQGKSTFTDYLAGMPQKLRWSANYAMRAGLTVAFHPLTEFKHDKILAFYRQYTALMAAKGTSDYYRFSESFFLEHARRLGNDCELAEVTDSEGQFLAGAFFLLDRSGWVHYHLSAASKKSMKLQGMELLMLSALHRYGQRGFTSLHLGGGHALDESDGLSRFKSKFADRKLEFHCSAVVCDLDAYERERNRLPLAHSSFFLISDARGIPPTSKYVSFARPA